MMGVRKWFLAGVTVVVVFGFCLPAAPPASAEEIYACENRSDGSIYLRDAGTTCRKNYNPISWNQEGPIGPQGLTGQTGPQGPEGPQGPPGSTSGRVYRWNVFSTYHQTGGWIFSNDPGLFGGVDPQIWTDSNGLASEISSDKEVQRTLFVNKSYPGKNATAYVENFLAYSSTDGKVVAVLFRVRNNTESSIEWPLSFRYTCYSGWSERASAALNGDLVWSDTGDSYGNVPATVSLNIPAKRTSTVIVVSTSSPNRTVYSFNERMTALAFVGNSLDLPAGLEFVDDLETAKGGYEQ